jgi:signal transduction histidine kinase
MTTASAAQQVETTLFRALIVVRVTVTVYALLRNWSRHDQFAEPGLLVVAMAAMVCWTAVALWAYDAPRRRRLPLYLADVAVAVVLVLSSGVIESDAMLQRHAPTVPTFWVMGPVLACAVGRGWRGGMLAALAVSAADLSVRVSHLERSWGNIFLLLLAAGVVGYTTAILKDAVALRAEAERAEAVQAERARLARAVHDGVLQVLSLVQRKASEGGGDLRELAALAAEQEVALRALVQADARSEAAPDTPLTRRPSERATRDLMSALLRLQSASVTVTGPGRPVELSAQQADELVCAVSACLDNVRTHVGELAPAWVFVEDLGDAVLVSVRDEGSGIPEGRLSAAADEGRLGVSGSICGRMADLGGTAELVTAPGQGTEWELRLPR